MGGIWNDKYSELSIDIGRLLMLLNITTVYLTAYHQDLGISRLNSIETHKYGCLVANFASPLGMGGCVNGSYSE